ncbi:MAG: hypothetical protein ACJAXH_001768 [Colwellia sp.]|jgi:hypothetical protein
MSIYSFGRRDLNVTTNIAKMIGELMEKKDSKVWARDLKTGIAVSDNKLVNACYRMSAVQKRLFNFAIASLHSRKFAKHGEALVNLEDYAFLTGKTLKEAIRTVRREVRSMSLLQVININYKERKSLNPRQNVAILAREKAGTNEISSLSYKNFFQEIEFIHDTSGAFVWFKFSDWLLPYIELLEFKFSQVPLLEIGKLGSFYSLRIYDFCMASQPIGKKHTRSFSLSELRISMGFVDDKENMYLRWADFRKRCLVEPIAELNEKTLDTWDFRVTGRGRIEKQVIITCTVSDQLDLFKEE